MSEGDSGSEKTHEATPKKLLDARKRGELPKSNDLSASAAYLGLILALFLSGSSGLLQAAAGLTSLIERPFSFISDSRNIDGSIVAVFTFSGVFIPILTLFSIPMISVVLCLIAQRAFVFAPSKLTPKLSKISPATSIKNKFGRSGLFEFAKSATKLVIACTLMVWFLLKNLDVLVLTTAMLPAQAVAILSNMILEFLVLIFVSSLLIGALDYLWQIADNLRKNRMTRKEIEDENKESEGDPHNKQKRKQRGYEIAMNQMLSEVPTANVVIVNPTHYAVALRWDAASGAPPLCVAKGVDAIAAQIREVANDSNVPIHSDPPTARSIYARIEIGEIIWPEDYKAVAAAIRFAQNLVAKKRN